MWLGGAAMIFALLWILQFGLRFQILYVAALSICWAIPGIDQQRAENRRLHEELEIELLRVSRFRRDLYLGAFYGLAFMIAVGTVGTACFLGGLMAAAFD
jgi:hypothetical protein